MRLLLLLLAGLILLLPVTAGADTFASTKAQSITTGATCKKATVEISDTKIVVECKKSGYARRLDELHNLRWHIKSGWGWMMAEEMDGAEFQIGVKKKEFGRLKAALIANLDEPLEQPDD